MQLVLFYSLIQLNHKQQMASPHSSENVTQCKTCRCGEGDTNLLTTRASDNPDKQTYKCPNCDVSKILFSLRMNSFCWHILFHLQKYVMVHVGFKIFKG